jgi:hypothetical protein
MQRGRCHGIELRFGIASEKLWRQKKNEDGGITSLMSLVVTPCVVSLTDVSSLNCA